MKVDIMLNERFYGTIDVKCLFAKGTEICTDAEIVREEIESRLPYLKGKNYKLFI